MRKSLLAILIIICVLNTKASGSLPFVKYQVENGLSHNTVWCVLQDSYDFMWFGTSDGLNCFDGKNFRIFRTNSKDKFSIGNNFVQSLFEDEQRNIWVGTNKGIYFFDRKTESFSYFNEKTEDGVLISSNVNKIVKSNSGSLWIATFGQGIFIYNPATKKLVQNTLYSSFVWNLLKTPDGNIFATSRQNGLICFDKNGKYLRSYNPVNIKNGLSNFEINALCYFNGNLWFNVGTYGFYKLNLKSGQMKPVAEENRSSVVSNIRSIFPYSNTQLWVGGDNGLYLFDLNSEKFSRLDDPSNPKSLSDQSVYGITRDREGGMWVSTYFGGVNYLPKNLKPFEQYFPSFQSGSISGKAISEFCEDNIGNIWIATEDGGLNYLNTKTQKAQIYKPLNAKNSISYHNIHSLLIDNNKLWIGTFSRGIDIFDLKSKTFRNYQHRRDDSKSVCDNAIYSLFRDSHGTIFVGTAWGLSKYDRATDSFSIIDEIGPMAHIFNILEDSRGFLWVATYNSGVFCLNYQTKKWNHYTHIQNNSRSVSGNSVISLFEDVRHTVWLGTEGGGLCSFNFKTKDFTAFDPDNTLLPNTVIYAIEQDEFENFWISSNAGLTRINPYTKKNRMIFTKADGLQSNQFNFRSSLRARNGKMYFGGINGFNTFYPKDFTQNQFVPKVRITEFRLFNKPVNVTDDGSPLSAPIYDSKEITLKYNQNTFSLSFISLSFQAPDKNQYTYIMEGVDKNWNISEKNNNSAYYTNLPPGKYTFRVKGSNNDGLWNKDEAIITIRILPPFWKSGFAYLLYVILILAVLFWLYKNWTIRQSKLHDERIKGYREKQEKESYLSKINFFTNLSHEIRTPLTLIKLPLERIISSGDGTERTKGFLNTIDKNTEYLLNLINQLLDFRKTEEVEFHLHIKLCNLNELMQDLYVRFHQSAEIKNIDLQLILPEQDIKLGVDREAFNKMVSNLMSNALKYAVSNVVMELQLIEHNFEVRISDDGKGITESERKKIFEPFYQSDNSKAGTGIGLALTRALAEKHNGTLKYENNTSGGSVFVISIPVSNTIKSDASHQHSEIAIVDYDYKKHLDKTILTNLNAENNIKLLIVEDNIELLQLTSGFMQDFYQVYQSTNGREALSILSEQNIDIVVSDVMMPLMDGYQLCESIKSNTQFCHIPVILLTAKTTVESKIMGLEYGSDAYLEKPFSLEHLHIQIINLLNSRQQLKELFATSPLLSSVEIVIAKKDIEYVERLNGEIEKHLLDVNFSIDTLSEFMNMSRSNFYRKLKSISGMSPNDYLKMIRLKKAAELLLSQDYRINEVYEKVGFSSSSYFAKCFKEQFGMLPREFGVKVPKGENPDE